MNRYTILRNNRESLSLTREELKCYGLLSTDLIWTEGESRSWQLSTEVPELKGLVRQDVKKPLPQQPSSMTGAAVVRHFAHTADEPDVVGHLRETGGEKTFSFTPAPPRRGDFVFYSKLFGATAFLLIGGFVYFVGKQLIQQSQTQAALASTAVEIKAEALPPSTTQHAAYAPVNTASEPVTVLAMTTDSAMVKATKPKKLPAALHKTVTVSEQPDSSEKETTQNNEPVVEPKKEEPVEAKPKPSPVNAAASLQVSANDYKVGMFGGVSNLVLTVSNPSSQMIDKALIEVDYLKPNGNVVKTQSVSVENLGAGATKTVSVPDNGRGVKVRWRVVSAE